MRSSTVTRSILLLCGAALLLGAAPIALTAEGGSRPALSPPLPDGGELPAEWIAAERIELWAGKPPGGDFVAAQADSPLLKMLPDSFKTPRFARDVATPSLQVFKPQKSNGRALLITPGGGFMLVAIEFEGLRVATEMTKRGYTVFVLTYRLPGEGWSAPADVSLQDAQRAVRIIRSRAGKYGFRDDHVAMLGFSAGGYVAALSSTNFAEKSYERRDSVDDFSARPDATGLIYPVITMAGPDRFQGAGAITGANPSPDLILKRSPEKQVSASTPPIFIVHALDDAVVPAGNSVAMMAAMQTAKRPVEAHFFEEGGHGFSLGDAKSPSGMWIQLYAAWLDRIFAR
jgi:Esterase/lipase